MQNNIPVVILAGGMGLRMRDYSENLPKALVPIGNMAVLHHVIKIYSHQGFRNFIICIGYKGDMIKEYFLNHHWKMNDFKLNTNEKRITSLAAAGDELNIIFADTGLHTQTGGRIKKIEKYIDSENFFVTYCDGLADIDLNRSLEFHLGKNKIGTLTAVHPTSPFGLVEINNGIVDSFKEKPALLGFINGGFFVFNKKIFDYLNENSILEEDPLRKLAQEKQLAAYNHNGFWACMDTFKDVDRLNILWETGVMLNVKYNKPPWKCWDS